MRALAPFPALPSCTDALVPSTPSSDEKKDLVKLLGEQQAAMEREVTKIIKSRDKVRNLPCFRASRKPHLLTRRRTPAGAGAGERRQTLQPSRFGQGARA